MLTDPGEAGELLVARARLAIAVLLLLLPVVSVAREPRQVEGWLGLGATLLSVGFSAAVFVAVQRGWRPRWLGVVTCLFDVTMVSAVLGSYLITGKPFMAVNSRITYEVYFIALAATSLRHDRRVSLITGAVATAQYTVLVAAALHVIRTRGISDDVFGYGTFSVADQAGRLILLLVATTLIASIVGRTERLRVLSTHDSLTGLYNRAYFDERLHEELLRARRYSRPLSVAIMDIDRFKQVNDQHGHPSGDAALRAFADLLRHSVRRTDIVARYGGEEFGLILPETSAADAHRKVDRMRERVARSVIDLPRAGRSLQLTFSAGMSSLPEDGDHGEELVRRADARLLAAKEGGRNRVMGPSVARA